MNQYSELKKINEDKTEPYQLNVKPTAANLNDAIKDLECEAVIMYSRVSPTIGFCEKMHANGFALDYSKENNDPNATDHEKFITRFVREN